MYLINNNYILSQSIKDNIDKTLNLEIDLKGVLHSCWCECVQFNDKLNDVINKKKNLDESDLNSESVNVNGSNVDSLELNNVDQSNINDLGVGGSDENVNSDLSQMEVDAKYIRENYKLIKPVEGVISSKFGKRNPTEIISENHCGIDIANDEGVVIKAALDGKVLYAGYSSSFGNFIKIEKNDLVVIYGHCLTLLVNNNDEVKQGQEIAKIGHTGNATGPHLHFEIRRENRAVDPEMIMEF